MLTVATWVTGCFEIADPAMPCGAVDLGDAEPSTVVNGELAPVLAMAADFSHRQEEPPFTLHYVCPHKDTAQEDCTLTRTDLVGLNGANAVLVTSAGRYVVATHLETRNLLRYRIDRTGVEALNSVSIVDNTPARLVASLRNSDWIIARSLEGDLLRYDPAGVAASRIAPDHDDMMLAAVGEQHIVGRVVLGEDREELYLVPVDSNLSYLHRGPVRLGAAGRIASRIVFARGDLTVSVTYGRGDSAETEVFQVPDGGLLQRFAGELLSGRGDMEELPGMRAVSPDGSHLAYRTPEGSLAMRDLDNASSCLVQSATQEETKVAGFSASGVLYFETATDPSRTSVKAWIPHRQERVEISRLDEGYTLSAVPARAGDEEETPWVVGLNAGTFAALQESLRPQSLGLGAPVFLSRDDAHLWVLNTRPNGSQFTDLEVLRVEPRWSNQMRALVFDDPTEPKFKGRHADEDDDLVDDPGPPKPVRITMSAPSRVCMSTGAPGSWAYACGEAADHNFLVSSSPSTEDPFGNPTQEPEVVPGEAKKCPGDGTPASHATGNCFEYNGCCYRSRETVCGMASCEEPGVCLFEELDPGHYRYLYCANPSDFPG